MKKLAIVLALVSSGALAETSVICSKEKQERKVVHEESASGCAVKVNDKVIYSAKKDMSYCTKKFEKHTKKLKGLGYACAG